MTWFYDLPMWLSLPAFVILFVAASWGILFAVRPWVRRVAEDRKEWDRVLGYSMSVYGLFYGILLALVAVSVYQNFVRVDDVVLGETSALGTLYRDVSGLSQPTSDHLQELLRSYTQHVITVDWPLQRQGIIPIEGTDQVSQFQASLFAYHPVGNAQQAIYMQTIASFNDFVGARRERLNVTTLALPGLLWALLWVGAIINALMIALIDVKRIRVHLVMAGLIAVFVALLIYVTWSLDHPFAGSLSIGPDDFSTLLKQVMGH